MTDMDQSTKKSEGMFTRVPIEVIVSVGRARPTIKELLELGQGAVLPLDSTVTDPVQLYVGDKLIATGELEVCEGDPPGQLRVRLINVGQDAGT